jgi:Tol biopolymer transport system component/C-terminal processing protease CtpA/Prc
MQPPASPRPYLRTPAVTPDGRRVAFAYAGDLWLVGIGGGDAERLTAHPATSTFPVWSPDGQRLAFSANRAGHGHGPGDLYVLPLDGGPVARITTYDAASIPEAWSPDGDFIFFRSDRERQDTAFYRVASRGGTPVPWLAQPYETLAHLAVSPDGARLAFNVARDPWWRRGPNRFGGAELWTVASAPGAQDFRRVSDAPGLNRWPCWDADGQGVYVVSDRDGVENLWYVPLGGAPPTRVTSFAEGRVLWPTISRDGRVIVFERDFGIWRLDVVSGLAEPISIRVRPDAKTPPPRVITYTRELNELALAPDGKKIAFVVHGEVFADFADKETDREQRQGASFRVSNTPAREADVAWSPDSRRLAYTSDRHGDEEIFVYDFVTRAETRLTNRTGRKSSPTYSPDGAWIAYTCGDDEIRLLRVETGEDQHFVQMDFAISTSFCWSPDSRWLIFVANDQSGFRNLYAQRIGETEPRQITFLSNVSAWGPIYAPNGQFVVFTTSNAGENQQVARVELRPPTPFFREAEFEKLFEQKPSSDERRPANDPPAAEAANGEPTGDGTKAAPNQEPRSKPNTPAPVEIVFEGIERRLRLLTPGQMAGAAQAISPDSRDLVISAVVAGKPNLWVLPLDEPRADTPPRQITTTNGHKLCAQFAPDGKSLAFLDAGQIFTRKLSGNDQSQLTVAAEVVIDFHREKLQMFDECWRLLRDHFYDPTFRGLDWSAARAQFAPLAAGVQTTEDLNAVISLMVGELRASHSGVYGGWPGARQDGYTGLIFDRIEQASSGRLVVRAIVPDSPAALAGAPDAPIRPGDELVAVEGVPLATTSLDTALQRTVGRRVTLRLRAATGEERDMALRPLGVEQYDDLRYRAWVYANEGYVHGVSDGRLGYVHIRRMDYASYQRFLADLDAEAYTKEGIVVDTRYNGGGSTGTFILDVLARRSVLLRGYRGRAPADAGQWHGNRVLNKPTVLVTNEESASNTEMFAESYRRLGLGKVVGRPTAGAVIGTYNHTLLNGHYIRLPRYNVVTPEGEDLEGTGRMVDVDVPLRLGEQAGEQDGQLDAAVQTLLAQIDALNEPKAW